MKKGGFVQAWIAPSSITINVVAVVVNLIAVIIQIAGISRDGLTPMWITACSITSFAIFLCGPSIVYRLFFYRKKSKIQEKYENFVKKEN